METLSCSNEFRFRCCRERGRGRWAFSRRSRPEGQQEEGGGAASEWRGLSPFGHDREEGEEHLVAVAIELAFIGHHRFDLIG